jgi:hypothetical protein
MGKLKIITNKKWNKPDSKKGFKIGNKLQNKKTCAVETRPPADLSPMNHVQLLYSRGWFLVDIETRDYSKKSIYELSF